MRVLKWGLEGLDLSVRLGQRQVILPRRSGGHSLGRCGDQIGSEAFTYRGRMCSRVLLEETRRSVDARLYKILTTLDMPLRVGMLVWVGWVKELTGNPEKASHNYSRLAAAAQFLFWGCHITGHHQTWPSAGGVGQRKRSKQKSKKHQVICSDRKPGFPGFSFRLA